jgi:hypothetical protein
VRTSFLSRIELEGSSLESVSSHSEPIQPLPEFFGYLVSPWTWPLSYKLGERLFCRLWSLTPRTSMLIDLIRMDEGSEHTL